MAKPSGKSSDAVNVLNELERDPHSFDFHVALRRLECAFRDRPRFGTAVRPSEEPVRIGQEPSMAFAPAELAAFNQRSDGGPARLSVAFMGLFGPNGALPTHLTEFARDRLRNAGDATFARFADIFHHRIFLLFHRAWSSTQPAAEHDRPEQDRFRRYIGSITGFGAKSVAEALPRDVPFYYAGLFATANRSAEGLANLLSDYFDMPIRIEEFVHEWGDLPESSRFRLGGSAETSALGRTSVVGARVLLCQQGFRVVMGPLERDAFRRLLPGGAALERLAALVRAYAGEEFTWDVRLVLAEDATEPLRLGRNGRLGWNSRLGAAGRVEDVIVNPSSNQTRRSAGARRPTSALRVPANGALRETRDPRGPSDVRD